MWIATPSGSSIAPSVAVRPSGSGKRQCSGQAIHSRIEPSSSPWPEKRMVGQRLGWPSRQSEQRPQGIAGSIATSRPSSVRPAISWPGTIGRVIRFAADPALLEPVEVRAAEADGLDADERLAGAGRRPLLLVEPDVAQAVQPGGAHHFFSWP